MGGSIGVTNLNGLAVPSGGFAHESSVKKKRPIVMTENAAGVTVFMDQMPHEEHAVSIKGTGVADLSIAAASNVAAGTVQITSVEASHELGKRPEFSIEGRKFVNDA